MKGFALLLTLAFAFYFVDVESRLTQAQITNGIATVKKTCMKKTGLKEELLEAAHRGEFADDPVLKCFYHCAMNMMKALKNGRLDRDSIIRQCDTMLPEDVSARAKEIFETCIPQATSEDSCEQVWEYAKCCWGIDSVVYFLP